MSRNRLIALLALLATFAIPSAALATWSSATDTDNFLINRDSVYTHSWTGAATDSNALDVSACDAGYGMFDPSTGDTSTNATMRFMACNDSTQPTSSCTPINFTSAGETTFSPVTLPKPYIRIQALAATVGGDTAEVSFKCVNSTTTTDAGSGSGDDQSPWLSNIDADGFDLTSGGDFTVESITYDLATSTCAGAGCGMQLPNATATPDIADSGTLKLYMRDTEGLAIYDDGALSGQQTDADGFEGLAMMVDEGGTTAGIVPRALTTSGTLYGPSLVSVSTGGVVSGQTQIKFATPAASTAAGVQLGQESGTIPAADADTLRVMAQSDRLRYVDDAGVVSNIATFGGGFDNQVARVDGTSGAMQGTTGFSSDDDGHALIASVESANSTGQLVIGNTTVGLGASVSFVEGADTGGSGRYVLRMGNTPDFTDASTTTLRLEQIARVNVAATGNFGAPMMAVSNGGTYDTGEELCDLQYAVNGLTADCIAGSTFSYGNGTTALLDGISCSTTVTSGDAFITGCHVP